MKHVLNKLTNLQCQKAKTPNGKKEILMNDGGGLYLRVLDNGSKAWVLRTSINGRKIMRGLGSFSEVTLAQARDNRNEYLEQIKKGIDPLETKRLNKFQTKEVTDVTFAQAFESYVQANDESWSLHHATRTESIARMYLLPKFKNLRLSAINDSMILEVLAPLNKEKSATVTKARSILSSVFDHARDSRVFSGVNPMLYLKSNRLLKRKPTVHSKSIETHKIGEFLHKLEAHENLIGKTFLFVNFITALRVGSLLEAKWSWLDTDRKVLNIPASKMKNNKPFVCPLPPMALEKLLNLKKDKIVNANEYIFKGRITKTISNNTPRLILNQVMQDRYHVHGFRTTMNVVLTKSRKFSVEAIEAALAHTNRNTIRTVYLASHDYFDERVDMANWYESYCLAEKQKYQGETKEVKHGVQ
jgi:integrase